MKKSRLVQFPSILVFLILFYLNDGKIAEESMCADELCSVTISEAKTLVRYFSPDADRISFEKGATVNVLGKAKNFWLIERENRKGYAPADFLRETKVFVKKDSLVKQAPALKDLELNTDSNTQTENVDVDVVQRPTSSLLNFPSVASAEAMQPQQDSKTSPPSPEFEVVDGTTLFLDPIATVSETQPSVAPSIPPDPTKTAPEYVPELTEEPNVEENHEKEGVTETPQTNLPLEKQHDEPTESINLREMSTQDTPLDTLLSKKERLLVTPLPSDVSTEATFQSVDQSQATSTVSSHVEEHTEANSESASQTTSQTETSSEVTPPAVHPPDKPTISDTESSISREAVEGDLQHDGVLSNLWNSVFSSGDGTEERTQENEEEDEVEEDDELVEEEEDGSNEVIADLSESEKVKEGSGDVSDTVVSSTSEPLVTRTQQSSSDLPMVSSSGPETTFTTSPPPDVDINNTPRPASPPLFSGVPMAVPPSEASPSLSTEVKEKIRLPRHLESIGQDVLGGVYPPESEIAEHGENQSDFSSTEAEKNKEQHYSNGNHFNTAAKQNDIDKIGDTFKSNELREEEETRAMENEQLMTGRSNTSTEQENLVTMTPEGLGNTLEQLKETTTAQHMPQGDLSIQDQTTEQYNQYASPVVEKPIEQFSQPSTSVLEEFKEEHNQPFIPAPHFTEQSDHSSVPATEQLSDHTSQPMDQSVPLTEPADQSDQTTEIPQEEQAAGNMFSWFSGLFADQQTQGTEVEPVVDQTDESDHSVPPPPPAPSPPPYYHEHPSAWGSLEKNICSSQAECDFQKEPVAEDATENNLWFGFEMLSLDALLLRFAATAVTLLLGVLTFYFVQKKQVDSVLVARINELEKQLLIATKEALMLSEEVSVATSRIDTKEMDLLREELNSSKAARADLEEQVASLERELEEATETGIELNNLLAQTLEASKGKAHAGLMASVERLQQQLDAQREKVDSLTRSLASTSAENESLKSVVAERQEKAAALEAELAAAAEAACNLRREREEVELEAAQKLAEVQTRLEEALSSKVLQETRLATELSALKLSHEKLRTSLGARDAEVRALQEIVKDLESKGDRADQLLDFAKLRAELEEVKLNRDECREKLEAEEEARKRLENDAKRVNEEVAKLRNVSEEAQKERLEAETRLTVLSNYFKEKEAQLLKELSLQEAIVAQHRGDESSVVKHLQSLQEEVETYRAQNESLKKEILDQERDFKGQIATLEKKAHDNWMAARQAERRLEDSRQEAAQLRNRLTLVEKNNAETGNRMETSGEGGIASPVMMVPLPPMGDMETPPPLPPFMFSPPPYPPPFMPPPPPPHQMGRPPPLGRMSSPPPPPIGQFSPPPPPYDRMDRSSRSPSPPPHRYHHRSPPPPQHWEESRASFRPVPKPSPKKPVEQRELKGSALSSGHSNESLEKSRHSDNSREHV